MSLFTRKRTRTPERTPPRVNRLFSGVAYTSPRRQHLILSSESVWRELVNEGFVQKDNSLVHRVVHAVVDDINNRTGHQPTLVQHTTLPNGKRRVTLNLVALLHQINPALNNSQQREALAAIFTPLDANAPLFGPGQHKQHVMEMPVVPEDVGRQQRNRQRNRSNSSDRENAPPRVSRGTTLTYL